MTASEIQGFKKARTDVDIDVKDSKDVISKLPCIRSTEIINSDGLLVHKSGIHFDSIPYDPCTGYASIQYKEAEKLGYQKVDILSQSAYKHVRDREHLIELMGIEPDWDLLLEPEIVNSLSQIKKHGMLLHVWKPKNVHQLAMFIAMIRPGKSKCKNMNTWEEVEKDIWNYDTIELDSNGNKHRYFKKPHAYAYSKMIIVQLNALVQHIISSSE